MFSPLEGHSKGHLSCFIKHRGIHEGTFTAFFFSNMWGPRVRSTPQPPPPSPPLLDRDQHRGKTKSPAATAGLSSAGSGLLGSVCMSCFVIPSNWPSLHPTLPYQGMARGGNRP